VIGQQPDELLADSAGGAEDGDWDLRRHSFNPGKSAEYYGAEY
jgi:hypothetical protein